MMGLHIIITGNPVDGLEFYGPYATAEEAIEFADRVSLEPDWWIAPLRSSQELEEDMS